MIRIHRAALLGILSVWACSKPSGEPAVPSQTEQVETVTRVELSCRIPDTSAPSGIFLLDGEGSLLGGRLYPTELHEGIHRLDLNIAGEVPPQSLVCVYPYQDHLPLSGGNPSVRVPSIQFPGKSVPQVWTGKGTVASGSVEISPLLSKQSVSVKGVSPDRKLHAVQMSFSQPLCGLAALDKQSGRIAAFDENYGSGCMTLAFPDGIKESSFDCYLPVAPSAVQSWLVIDDEAVYEGSGEADLEGVDKSGTAITYSWETEGGKILAGDIVDSGTLDIPSIENRQITRVLLTIDPATSPALHTIWLECYNGTSWEKIAGTETLVSPESVALTGSLVDIRIPKSSVSATGAYRIFNGGGAGPTVIRTMTLVHEAETCTHNPLSLIADGYKSGWSICGTGENAANNFFPKQLTVVDQNVSHVDDGSGSLRLGGLDCWNNFKPWTGWRYKDMDIEEGATYRVYFCIKTENLPSYATMFLSLGFKDASNQWLTGWVEGAPTANNLNATTSPWSDKVKGTHDWIKMTGEITAPAGARKMSYFQFMLQGIISAPDAFVWIDDVNMIKVN